MQPAGIDRPPIMPIPRLARLVALSLLTITVLSACARLGLTRSINYDWEAEYAPAAGCVLRVSPGARAPTPETGALVVRLTLLGSTNPVPPAVVVTLTPLGVQPSTLPHPPSSADTGAIRRFAAMTPGQYVMFVRGFGFSVRTDTVTVRAGATDTVHAALTDVFSEYRNTHNCRPHRFRHRGEPACVTDSAHVESALRHARSIMSPVRGQSSRPSAAAVPLVIVRDERVCERAGRAYGGRGSPPRRVVVVAVGDRFIVSDPYEPLPAGEWDLWILFDRRWRVVELYLG
jgi:hypothetical protein